LYKEEDKALSDVLSYGTEELFPSFILLLDFPYFSTICCAAAVLTLFCLLSLYVAKEILQSPKLFKFS